MKNYTHSQHLDSVVKDSLNLATLQWQKLNTASVSQLRHIP